MHNIYCLELEKYEWSLVYESKDKNEPEPRSNFSMVVEGDYLYVFGGTNGQNTLNDFWKFSLSSKRWELIKT